MGGIMSFRHLEETEQRYVPHGMFAVSMGWFLICTGFISIIHGIFPFILTFNAPRRVMKVAKIILRRGKREEIPPQDLPFWRGLLKEN